MGMQPGRISLPLLALLGGATGIGFAPILVRLTDTGPTATAFYRLLFALPLLWLWSAFENRRVPSTPQPRRAADFTCLVLCGLLFTADLSIWHWSLRLTNVANSTLLTNVAPIFVTIGARFLLNETITRNFVLGLVLAVAGSALLVATSVQLEARHLRGDVLAMIAAIFYGGYLLMVKYLRRRFATPTIMAWSGLASCPAFAIVALASGDSMQATRGSGWVAIVALALVSHVGGQTLITYGFGHLPASFSSISLLWQPVVAAVAAWAFLNEPLTWWQVAGGLVVLAGIAFATSTMGPAPASVAGGTAPAQRPRNNL
jgi:drug/metabolite transporter (DMT)-like permease